MQWRPKPFPLQQNQQGGNTSSNYLKQAADKGSRLSSQCLKGTRKGWGVSTPSLETGWKSGIPLIVQPSAVGRSPGWHSAGLWSPEPVDGFVQVSDPTDGQGVLEWERWQSILQISCGEDRVWFNPLRIILCRNLHSPHFLVSFSFLNKDQVYFNFIFQHKIFFFLFFCVFLFLDTTPRLWGICWQKQSHHKGPGHETRAGRFNREHVELCRFSAERKHLP